MPVTMHLPARACALAVAALALAGALPARSQSPKIAVVNTDQILRSSETGRKALDELRQLQEKKQAEIKAKQDELQALRDKIDQGRLSLSEDKLNEMQSQLEKQAVDFKRFQEDAQNELNKKRDDILDRIESQVMPVINQVGKDGGYTMIFRKFESGLVYVDDAIDITDEVVKRVDAAKAAKQGAAAKPDAGGGGR